MSIYRIHAYDLVSFVQEVQKAVKQGYEVDLKTVENYPVLLGTQFVMTMVKSQEGKQEKEAEQEATVEAAQETQVQEASTDTSVVQEAVVEAVKTPGKPGRKADSGK